MPASPTDTPLSHSTLPHGCTTLPAVRIDGYSLQLHAGKGYLGDSVSRQAFGEMLDAWRALLRTMDGKDPLGHKPAAALDGDHLDDALKDQGPAGAAVRAAVEDYAQQLAHVLPRFLRDASWKGVERVVFGGGFTESAHGQRAIRRAGELLQEKDHAVELCTLRHHTDEGGLIGWAHIVPPALLRRHDALLAVDIGGTHVRCGIVRTRADDAPDLSKAEVVLHDKWTHGDDDGVTRREHMLDGIAAMLAKMVRHADKEDMLLAPFVGVACPGLIGQDGSIHDGAQNLPGDWESHHFHLPGELARRLPAIEGLEPLVCLHNDAVVQGLSQLPFMHDVQRWAVLTVGTGLGNASYTNRAARRASPRR